MEAYGSDGDPSVTACDCEERSAGQEGRKVDGFFAYGEDSGLSLVMQHSCFG